MKPTAYGGRANRQIKQKNPYTGGDEVPSASEWILMVEDEVEVLHLPIRISERCAKKKECDHCFTLEITPESA